MRLKEALIKANMRLKEAFRKEKVTIIYMVVAVIIGIIFNLLN